MHRSLAKQDTLIDIVNLKILPVKKFLSLAFHRESQSHLFQNLPIIETDISLRSSSTYCSCLEVGVCGKL
jgi:hypothetical protein